jgi:rRNA biogenesis protein RRP5
LQSLESGGSELQWVEKFSIGSVIEGKIEEIKDIGVVVSFEKYHDVFGFITHYQCKFFTLYFGYLVDYCCLLALCYCCNVIFAVGGTIAETGSLVRAVVLDVALSERLVDCSLKPEFFDETRGESLKSQSHKKVKFYALYLGALNHFDCGVMWVLLLFMLLSLCCYLILA